MDSAGRTGHRRGSLVRPSRLWFSGEYFWKFFVCPSTVPKTYGLGNIFHHNCPHLQHGINVLRFADIWAQFDTLRAVVVQLRVWDKEAVSGPRHGI